MIFKRKKKASGGMTWEDVTLGKFQDLKGLDLTELDGQIDAARVLLGVEVDDMTWAEFCKELNRLKFLDSQIPEGKEYGSGYDMEEVYQDILSMSIVDAYAVFNFFRVQFIVCIKTMKDFSVRALRRNPELRDLVSEAMECFYTSGL